MCGICGCAGFHGVTEATVTPMLEALAPRGPDARGVWISPDATAVLGHTRLSIIDVAKSAQPLANEDGAIVVTYNGEIYNFHELRSGLQGGGHEFRTEGDTEVLVHLYEECGAGMVRRLDGMFAFGLFDVRRQSLLLARDRIGIKPLYFWHDPRSGGIIFASDLHSLLAHALVPRYLSRLAFAQYLHFGYVIHPETWLRNVRQLEPGQLLHWRAGQINVSRYFDWCYAPEPDLRSPAAALAKLRDTLEEVVEQHLISDVPLGSFLSGGIDSTVITAIAQQNRRRRGGCVNSYTVRFWTKTHDESQRARAIAQDLGTQHTEIDAQEIRFEREFIERLLRGLGEPHADTSALAVYFLCRQVRPHIKVALSGDGGDELFFGYKGIRKQRLARQLRSIPAWARHAAVALTMRGRSDFRRRANKYLRLSLLDNQGLIIDWARRWEWAELRAMLETDLFDVSFPFPEAPFPEVRQAIGTGETGGLAEQQLQFHMRIDMPCDCLFKVDRMSMAHGLEVRVPLLANKMLEYGQELPIEVRAEGNRSKEPLRTLGEIFAPTLRQPAPKHGFSFPLDCWVRGKLARHWREWDIAPQLVQLGFRRSFLDGLVAAHERLGASETNYHSQSISARLFDLLLLALWMRNNRLQF